MPAQPLSDTARRYGPLTRLRHWGLAALVLAAMVLGVRARWLAGALAEAEGAALPDLVTRTAAAFSWHKTLGLTVLAFAAISLLLRRPDARRPGLIRGDRAAEAFAARCVHAVLATGLILLPLTGWLIHSAGTGFAPHLLPLPQSLPFVPPAAEVFTGMHRAALVLLVLALALHVAGALRHHFRDRDATLTRMALGRAALGSEVQPARAPPRLAAAALWLAALLAGAWLGAAPHPTPPEGRGAAGGWHVTEGDIRLSVRQFGREIAGRFSDWDARIDWDETAPPGPAGHVTVTIDLDSLTLGPLTVQALGPDFLNTAAHPRATFTAGLVRVVDGQIADGTLTLAGQTRAVAFPFRLSIDGRTAYAGGSFTLDRRDFGIGANLPEPKVLDHAVKVEVTLQAERRD